MTPKNVNVSRPLTLREFLREAASEQACIHRSLVKVGGRKYVEYLVILHEGSVDSIWNTQKGRDIKKLVTASVSDLLGRYSHKKKAKIHVMFRLKRSGHWIAVPKAFESEIARMAQDRIKLTFTCLCPFC